MRLIKGILILVFFFLTPVFSVKNASASEGLIELSSTTGQNLRCFASSLLMQDGNYVIPITCRNLVYPVEEGIFSYFVWATPLGGGSPVRLGELGFGRAEYKIRTAFSSLFVSVEQNKKTRTPSGTIVMRGNVAPIIFLETSPTPSPEGLVVEEPTPTPKPSLRTKVSTAVKRAGIAVLLAVVAVMGLVFVLTRPK